MIPTKRLVSPGSEMDEMMIQELVDARDTENLMIEYFDAVDLLDPFRVARVFTDDAEVTS